MTWQDTACQWQQTSTMCIYLHHCLLGFFEFKTMFLQAFLPKQSQKQSQCIAQTGSKSSPGTKPSLPLRFGKMWNLANSLQNSRRTALTHAYTRYAMLYQLYQTDPNRIWQCPCLQPAPITQHTSPSDPGNHRRRIPPRGPRTMVRSCRSWRKIFSPELSVALANTANVKLIGLDIFIWFLIIFLFCLCPLPISQFLLKARLWFTSALFLALRIRPTLKFACVSFGLCPDAGPWVRSKEAMEKNEKKIPKESKECQRSAILTSPQQADSHWQSMSVSRLAAPAVHGLLSLSQ